MPHVPYANVPWCSGRGYCNAPPQWKLFCETRPPPYWWIVNLSNFSFDPAGEAGDHICRPSFYQLGFATTAEWMDTQSPASGRYVRVTWERSAGLSGWWELRVSFRYGNSDNKLKIWTNGGHVTPEIWNRDFDRFAWVNTFTGPNWIYGNVQVELNRGLYSRLPAHSCRGDYNGEWP